VNWRDLRRLSKLLPPGGSRKTAGRTAVAPQSHGGAAEDGAGRTGKWCGWRGFSALKTTPGAGVTGAGCADGEAREVTYD